jgi:hypothetical protein
MCIVRLGIGEYFVQKYTFGHSSKTRHSGNTALGHAFSFRQVDLPWFRQLSPNWPLRPGFGLRSVRVESVVDQVPLWHVTDRVLQVSGLAVIPPVIDMYSLNYRGNCIILATTSLLNGVLKDSHSWGCNSNEPLVNWYLAMEHHIQKHSVLFSFFRNVRKIAKSDH